MKETVKETAEKLNEQLGTEICKGSCGEYSKEHIDNILLAISLNKALSLVVHVMCTIAMILGVMLLVSSYMLISMAVEIHYVYSLVPCIKIIAYLVVGSVLAVSSLYCMMKLNEKI